MDSSILLVWILIPLTISMAAVGYMTIVVILDPYSWQRAKYVQFRKATGHGWIVIRLAMALPITLALVGILRLLDPYTKNVRWLSTWGTPEYLAFVAIVFAIVQFLDARQEEHEAERLTRELNRLAERMSTQVIGLFPENLLQITNLIRSAKTHVHVIVDFAGYGQYSAPKTYTEYLNALKKAAGNRNIEMRLICYDSILGDRERKLQFPKDPPAVFEGLKDRNKFNTFFENLGIAEDKRPKSNEDLRKALQAHETDCMDDLGKCVQHSEGLQRRFLSEPVTLFLWLIDKQEAVFTFKNLEKQDRAYSIRTRDGWLIEQFDQYFSSAFDKASPDWIRTVKHPDA
jgi:hypothetical protein